MADSCPDCAYQLPELCWRHRVEGLRAQLAAEQADCRRAVELALAAQGSLAARDAELATALRGRDEARADDGVVLKTAFLIGRFFGADHEKALLWFNTPNPLFGEIRPIDMIALGRAKMLLRIVEDQMAENASPVADGVVERWERAEQERDKAAAERDALRAEVDAWQAAESDAVRAVLHAARRGRTL